MSVPVDGAVLAGEVRVPEGEPLGSVLLLSGSGPQDRFQTIDGVGTLEILAEAICAEGFTVTIWDDRGVGGSTGEYLEADEDDLAADVCAIAAWLSARTGRADHLLVGHSQGTLVAMLAALASPGSFRGLVLLAPPGRPGREVLLWQHRRLLRAAGASEDEAELSCRRQGRLFDILSDWSAGLGRGGEGSAARDRIAGRLKGVLAEGIEGDPDEPTRAAIDEAVEDLMEWEWRFLLRSEPARLLSRLRCPVAVIVGDMDDHIDARADVDALRASGKTFALKILSNHDHLFRHIGPVPRSGARPFSDVALKAIRETLREICHEK